MIYYKIPFQSEKFEANRQIMAIITGYWIEFLSMTKIKAMGKRTITVNAYTLRSLWTLNGRRLSEIYASYSVNKKD